MTQAPISSAGLDEETARAELYGLLAALYYAPPVPQLMAQLRVAVTEAPAAGGFLEEPWRALVGAARELDDASIAAEYTTLFGGVGKPEVYLFGSFYLSGFLNEKPLAALRADIAELGLARDDAMSETEDHFAYLCEVMRYLIAGDDVVVANLTRQQSFFATHMQPWTGLLCDSLAQHPKAKFYAAVAELTRAFMNVEAQGFDMLT
jgi:TorA maturation chaperone TorD